MNGEQVCTRRLAIELNNLGVALLKQVDDDEAANGSLRLALEAWQDSSSVLASSEEGCTAPVQLSDANDVYKNDSTVGRCMAMIQEGRKILEASSEGAGITRLRRPEKRNVKIQNTFLFFDPIRIEYAGGQAGIGNDVNEGVAIAIIMHNISVIFCRHGSWDRAIQMNEAALDLVVSVEECDAYPYVGSLVYPILLNNLGHLMIRTRSENDKDGAKGMFAEALRVAHDALIVTKRYRQDREELQAMCSRCIATIFYNNGRLHYLEGENDQGTECLFEALFYSSPSNPSLRLSILFTMSSIGRCYLKQGRSYDATTIFHKALRVQGTICNTGDSTLPAEVYSSIYLNLGFLCCKSGKQLEAMKYFSTSLQLITEALGSTHSHVVGLQAHIDQFWRHFLEHSGVTHAAQAA